MMNSNFVTGPAYYGWHLHMVFSGMLIVGLILFIFWAVKHLKKDQLLNWTLALLVIGLLGVFLTAATGGEGFVQMMNDMHQGYYPQAIK